MYFVYLCIFFIFLFLSFFNDFFFLNFLYILLFFSKASWVKLLVKLVEKMTKICTASYCWELKCLKKFYLIPFLASAYLISFIVMIIILKLQKGACVSKPLTEINLRLFQMYYLQQRLSIMWIVQAWLHESTIFFLSLRVRLCHVQGQICTCGQWKASC